MERSIRFNDQAACVRAWADQRCAQGHASNLFFEGTTIFSYGMHFPMATLFGNVVFYNQSRYSVSTSHQQFLVRSAIEFKRVIAVHVLPVAVDPRYDRNFQERNIENWLRAIQACWEELSVYPKRSSLSRKIEAYTDQIRQFIDLLGIAPTKVFAGVLADMTQRKITVFLRRPVGGRIIAGLRQPLNYRQLFLKQLAAWERGLLPVVSYSMAPTDLADTAYLRFNEATNRIETSKEIQMPVALAYRCWRSIQDHIARREFDCDIPLLSYNVSKITAKHVFINCHAIPVIQIEKIAKQLGWQYPEPAGNHPA